MDDLNQLSDCFVDFKNKPFLKWVGGKQNYVTKLLELLPDDYFKSYCEPFLGAAAIFMNVKSEKAILSDLNRHLILMYQTVRRSPKGVFDALQLHSKRDSEAHYYQIREQFNNGLNGTAAAAAFIYMNRAGFNGVYRVNRKGEYNVPYGHKTSKLFLPDRKTIKRLSLKLRGVKLRHKDFAETIEQAPANSFIYCDPPYHPVSVRSDGEELSFTKYTRESFGFSDQERLRVSLGKAQSRGCKVLVTNSDTPEIRKLYSGWNLSSLTLTRYVNTKSKRTRVGELVIRNY